MNEYEKINGIDMNADPDAGPGADAPTETLEVENDG